MFSLLYKEKFNKNAKVEQLTKVVLCHGEENGLIVKDPYGDKNLIFSFTDFIFSKLGRRRKKLKSGHFTI